MFLHHLQRKFVETNSNTQKKLNNMNTECKGMATRCWLSVQVSIVDMLFLSYVEFFLRAINHCYGTRECKIFEKICRNTNNNNNIMRIVQKRYRKGAS